MMLIALLVHVIAASLASSEQRLVGDTIRAAKIGFSLLGFVKNVQICDFNGYVKRGRRVIYICDIGLSDLFASPQMLYILSTGTENDSRAPVSRNLRFRTIRQFEMYCPAKHYVLSGGFSGIPNNNVNFQEVILSNFFIGCHLFHRQPGPLVQSRRRDIGIQNLLALPIARRKRFLGIVGDSPLLRHHVLRGLPDFVGSVRHITHFCGLSVSGLRQRMGIGRTRLHRIPLEADKNTSEQVDANDYPCQPESRTLVVIQLFLYVLEFTGGMLLCFLGVNRLDSLDFWAGARAFLGVMGGTVLVAHSVVSVTQKYFLTTHNYCNTVMVTGRANMANVLSTDKQVAVISALAEGSGIRQIERITGVHRDTIMRLGVRIGKGCANVLDRKMRNLSCNHLQFDEVWGFIGKKERHCTPDDSPEVGDVWTFCAIDSDTKIVPSFKVGKRDSSTANAFVADVASRLKNRVQISSDALRAYVEAVEIAFGANVDFAQIVKTYVHEDAQNAERKYSAPEFVIEEKKAIAGFPDMLMASTSHIERLNGTTRLHMRRLTRLTYAFSKKRENFEAAVALHFAYYNFVKRHNTLRCTPAMAAGIERDFWSVRDLVEAAA